MTRFVEGLENRALLAADLVAAVPSYALPAGARAGVGIVGSVNVTVRNVGTSAVGAGARPVEVDVYLKPASGGGGAGVRIGVRKGVPVARLGKGAAEGVSVPVSLAGAGVTAGTFSVVAIVDVGNKVAESNENNNQGAAAARKYVVASAARGDLAVGSASTTLTKAGVAGTGSAVIRNAGAVAVSGTADVVFEARPSLRFMAVLNLGRRSGVATNLRPGETVSVTGVPLSALPANTLTQDVTYTITARLVTNVRPADANKTNDTATAGTVTVTGKGITNPLSAARLGTRLTFSVGSTTTGQVGVYDYVDGAMDDGAVHAGTYRVRTAYASHPAELTIDFPAQGATKAFHNVYSVTPIGTTTFIPSGLTLVFSDSPVNAAARLQSLGDGSVWYLVPVG